jgi:hypothetical protein
MRFSDTEFLIKNFLLPGQALSGSLLRCFQNFGCQRCLYPAQPCFGEDIFLLIFPSDFTLGPTAKTCPV